MMQFVTGKVGRWFLGVFAVLLGTGAALLQAFRAGKAAERTRRQKQVIDAIRERKKSDASIDRMPADDRRKRLSDRWGR